VVQVAVHELAGPLVELRDVVGPAVAEHEPPEQEEPRHEAQEKPDHVGGDVVRERVLQAEHVSGDPQADRRGART